MAKIGIIGAGSWSSALCVLLHNNGHEVSVWSALPDEIDYLKKYREHRSLPGVRLSDDILFTSDIREAVDGSDMLVMAVASPYVRSTARALRSAVREGQIIVSVAKGIEEGTMMTLSGIIEEEIPGAKVGVLCGPSHAEEVGRGLPTTVVAGCKSRKTAEYIQDIFMSEVFRVYISSDVLGMELGGSLKNVVALAAGIADGLGYGDNAKAALITRGIAEITRLGIAMGGKAETFAGLTGIGDLIVTCESMHSRNRRAGILIGQGFTAEEAMKEVGMVVEGVYSARSAMELAQKYHVSMPIIEEVNKVLFDGKSPDRAVRDLMMRDRKAETENGWEE